MPGPLQRDPIYQQLNDRLQAALVEGFDVGDRFLTERQISESFGVSRATANKALAGLVSQGQLEFRRGVGTFVRQAAINYNLRSLVSFTDQAKVAGKRPSTELLRFELLPVGAGPKEIRETLGLSPTGRLRELVRLRLADGEPVIHEHRYVAHRLCPKLTKQQACGSLYEAWTSRHGLEVSGAEETIRAVGLDEAIAGALRVAPQTPALQVCAIGYADEERPLWWELTHYVGDLYEFQSRLGPVRGSSPARGVLRERA